MFLSRKPRPFLRPRLFLFSTASLHGGCITRNATHRQRVIPELFFWKLSSRFSDRSLFAADTGMSTIFFARAVKVRADMKVAISGTLRTTSVAFCSGR